MSELNGTWTYNSFCPQGGIKAKDASRSPEIAAPWAKDGELTVATDASGKVTGKLVFPAFPPGAFLAINGSIMPATPELPEGIELTGEGLGASYSIRGFFVPDSDQVVGTVVVTKGDLGVRPQPVGTSGPFVLRHKPE